MGRKLKKNLIEKKILDCWGFEENLNIIEENIGYKTERATHIWNINNEYILKITDSEDEMKRNVYITNLLSKSGIPVQRVISTIDKKEYIQIESKYYGLFTRIKGEVLKDYYEGDYVKRGFYLGQCLVKLHNGLKRITNELKENEDILDNEMIKELDGWVNDEISKYITKCKLDNNEIDKFNIIRSNLDNNFKELYYKLPRQAIHRDFHGENMVFKDDKLVGYIDFDLSQINARIFDVCYLCTGALIGIFNNKELREKWIEFSRVVISGYKSEGKITVEENESIKYMMHAIELIMIAYFAREGYEKIADKNIEMINWIDENWTNV